MLNPIICRSRPVKRTCPARRAPSPPARPQAAHSAPTVRSAAPEWLGRVLTVSMSLHVSGLPLGDRGIVSELFGRRSVDLRGIGFGHRGHSHVPADTAGAKLQSGARISLDGFLTVR